MSTCKENAPNEQYVYQFDQGALSEVITYKKNLVDKIKQDANAQDNQDIQDCSWESVTEEKFKKFTETATAAKYTIYKVRKL